MKRSSKVVLLFMGTAAAGSLASTAALPQTRPPCDPRPGFFMPGGYDARCMYRGGFGGSGHRFAGHSHAFSHGG
jgi:hypothetical protein